MAWRSTAQAGVGCAKASRWIGPAFGIRARAQKMLRDAWSMRLSFAPPKQKAVQKQLHDVVGQIEGHLDLTVETCKVSVAQAYEATGDKRERQKIVLQERLG